MKAVLRKPRVDRRQGGARAGRPAESAGRQGRPAVAAHGRQSPSQPKSIASDCLRARFCVRPFVQVEEMLEGVAADEEGNFKYKDFVAKFRTDA